MSKLIAGHERRRKPRKERKKERKKKGGAYEDGEGDAVTCDSNTPVKSSFSAITHDYYYRMIAVEYLI